VRWLIKKSTFLSPNEGGRRLKKAKRRHSRASSKKSRLSPAAERKGGKKHAKRFQGGIFLFAGGKKKRDITPIYHLVGRGEARLFKRNTRRRGREPNGEACTTC